METAIIAPDNAPEWATDRTLLWNKAEDTEKHPRARTARQLEVAFPYEYDADMRKEAGLNIAQKLMERYQVAVDIAWHDPNPRGDERNHHVHLLFTTRSLDEDGFGKKTRALDDKKTGPEEILVIREQVAEVLNDISSREKLPVYTEHLSFDKLGINREPTIHIGPRANTMVREGLRRERMDENIERTQRNEALAKVESQRSVVQLQVIRDRQKAPAPSPLERMKAYKTASLIESYEKFYDKVLDARRDMNQRHDLKYGSVQSRYQKQIAELENSLLSSHGISGMWRQMTGKSQSERSLIDQIQRNLEHIETIKKEEYQRFEIKRQEHMEKIKQKHEDTYDYVDQMYALMDQNNRDTLQIVGQFGSSFRRDNLATPDTAEYSTEHKPTNDALNQNISKEKSEDKDHER